MSHLRGNRARRLAPTARQTKLSVFVFAVQRVSCVCTDDRVRRSMIAALWLAICVLWDVFIYFISPGSENNLQGVWLFNLAVSLRRNRWGYCCDKDGKATRREATAKGNDTQRRLRRCCLPFMRKKDCSYGLSLSAVQCSMLLIVGRN